MSPPPGDGARRRPRVQTRSRRFSSGVERPEPERDEQERPTDAIECALGDAPTEPPCQGLIDRDVARAVGGRGLHRRGTPIDVATFRWVCIGDPMLVIANVDAPSTEVDDAYDAPMASRLTRYGNWLACCLSRGPRSPLGDGDVELLAEEMGEQSYAGGTFVFRQGDPAAKVHVLRSGSVELSRQVRGRRVTLQVLRPGDVFGDVPVFLGEPEPFDARALQDSSVLSLDAAALYPAVGRPAMVRLPRRADGRIAAPTHRLVGGRHRVTARVDPAAGSRPGWTCPRHSGRSRPTPRGSTVERPASAEVARGRRARGAALPPHRPRRPWRAALTARRVRSFAQRAPARRQLTSAGAASTRCRRRRARNTSASDLACNRRIATFRALRYDARLLPGSPCIDHTFIAAAGARHTR